MLATAMATTVSTVAATALVSGQVGKAPTVVCECEAPAAPVVATTSIEPAAAVPASAAEVEPGPEATVSSDQYDREFVRKIVRAHINEVRYCYNQGLATDPQLAGRVEVQFTIGADGYVSESLLTSSDLADESVGECIRGAVARWKFPSPSDGNPVVITYPFVLEPG